VLPVFSDLFPPSIDEASYFHLAFLFLPLMADFFSQGPSLAKGVCFPRGFSAIFSLFDAAV